MITSNCERIVKMIITIGGEANGGALRSIRVCVVQAGVAALVLDSDRLDGELAVGEGRAEPSPPLERRLDHGVALLCVGGHHPGVPVCREVTPYNLLHLFGQTVGAGQGGPLAAHCCLVAVNGDECCESKGPAIR